MKAVVQRVLRAEVRVEGQAVGTIGPGLCVFVGVAKEDQPEDAAQLARRLLGLRIFSDQDGKMNASVTEVEGALLLVSQFTLLADTRRGRRPSFGMAMEPVAARQLFESFVQLCRDSGLSVETGQFQADMKVSLENDGPVTLLLDTRAGSSPSAEGPTR